MYHSQSFQKKFLLYFCHVISKEKNTKNDEEDDSLSEIDSENEDENNDEFNNLSDHEKENINKLIYEVKTINGNFNLKDYLN